MGGSYGSKGGRWWNGLGGIWNLRDGCSVIVHSKKESQWIVAKSLEREQVFWNNCSLSLPPSLCCLFSSRLLHNFSFSCLSSLRQLFLGYWFPELQYPQFRLANGEYAFHYFSRKITFNLLLRSSIMLLYYHFITYFKKVSPFLGKLYLWNDYRNDFPVDRILHSRKLKM